MTEQWEFKNFTREEYESAWRKYGAHPWMMYLWAAQSGTTSACRDLWRSRQSWFAVGVLTGLYIARIVYAVTR